MNKALDAIGQIIEKDTMEKASRQVGDTKVGKDGKTRYWTELSSGKFDWRKKKPKTEKVEDDSKASKLKNHLKNTDDDSLEKYASGDKNDPTLRQFAYDELVERGVDVSEIELNTGKTKEMKDLFSSEGKETNKNDKDSIDESENDWKNPDYIKKKFGGLKTKKQRIAADAYIYSNKTKEDSYKEPFEEIHALNKAYAQFLITDSPLMIASGGAGVGKSFNLHAVAKVLNKKPFDPEVDEPGDSDYDYVEAPEIKSDTQLILLLKEHNGKTIVFDDSDNVLRQMDTMGIMKKATASSGKRMIGKKSANKSSNVDPFEFDGKILFLTNMNQNDLTKNEHLNAIYSRALKKDINFTKKEKLGLISQLRHKMNFTGIERLEDSEEDKKEREDVFKIIEDNINKIDPEKFNTRTFKEALEIKRSIDNANKLIEEDPVTNKLLFGEIEDWEPEVENFISKGLVPLQNEIEKALNQLDLVK